MIHAIIFDCFGVLYQGSLDYLMDRCPSNKRPQLKDLSVASDYGYISRKEYIETVATLVGINPTELESIIAMSHIRNDYLIGEIRRLRTKYKTALLSNIGQDSMNRLFTKDEFDELFDVVVLSSNVGMVKPNPEIFEYTAQKLGVDPGACVMVDDLIDNVNGAISIGMNGIHYTSINEYDISLKKVFDN